MKTYVYIIGECYSDFRKIGVARNLTKRLKQLQVANPRPLIIEHSLEFETRAIAEQVECRILSVNQEHRLNGEWLNMPLDIAKDELRRASNFVLNTRSQMRSWDPIIQTRRLGMQYDAEA